MIQDSIEKRCAVCGNEFMLPGAERRFRSERGLSDPLACPECRSRARATRNAELLAVVSANGNGEAHPASSSARRTGGPRGRNIPAGDGPAQRYPAICASCGVDTMVPFLPRKDRPIYCRECFNARKGR